MKKTYMKPVTNVVSLQQQHIICVSLDPNGMNKNLQDEEVDAAWAKEKGDWDIWGEN